MFKKSNLQLSEEIFDMVLEYASKKNPKRHYTGIIGDIEKVLHECKDIQSKVVYGCEKCGEKTEY